MTNRVSVLALVAMGGLALAGCGQNRAQQKAAEAAAVDAAAAPAAMPVDGAQMPAPPPTTAETGTDSPANSPLPEDPIVDSGQPVAVPTAEPLPKTK